MSGVKCSQIKPGMVFFNSKLGEHVLIISIGPTPILGPSDAWEALSSKRYDITIMMVDTLAHRRGGIEIIKWDRMHENSFPCSHPGWELLS